MRLIYLRVSQIPTHLFCLFGDRKRRACFILWIYTARLRRPRVVRDRLGRGAQSRGAGRGADPRSYQLRPDLDHADQRGADRRPSGQGLA